MVKRNFTCYIESELIELAKAMGLNISKIFEESLRAVIDVKENPHEIDNLIKEKQELQVKLIGVSAKIQSIEKDKQRKIENEKLKKNEEEKKWRKL